MTPVTELGRRRRARFYRRLWRSLAAGGAFGTATAVVLDELRFRRNRRAVGTRS